MVQIPGTLLDTDDLNVGSPPPPPDQDATSGPKRNRLLGALQKALGFFQQPLTQPTLTDKQTGKVTGYADPSAAMDVANTALQNVPPSTVSYTPPTVTGSVAKPDIDPSTATYHHVHGDPETEPQAPDLTFSGGGAQFHQAVPNLPVFKPAGSLAEAMTDENGIPKPINAQETKLGKFLHLLITGAQGGIAGRAAAEQAVIQSGGRRSGGFGMGFEAGQEAPYKLASARLGLAAEQAKLEQQRAQTALLQESVPITLANGQQLYVPKSQLGQIGRGALGSSISAEGGLEKERLAGQNKLAAIRLQTEIAKQQATKYIPDVDENGQKFYHMQNKYGEEIGQVPVDMIPGLQARTTDTVEWKTDVNGNLFAAPKTTVSTPVLPGGIPVFRPRPAGGAPAAAGGGVPAVAGGRRQMKVPDMVYGTDPSGNEVAGTPAQVRAAGVNNFAKLPADKQGQVVTARQLVQKDGLFNMIQNDLAQFKPDELDGLGNRWQEFILGNWMGQLATGGADPRYVNLRTHLNGLGSTAIMQAHVGARGSENMMEHFEDLANAKKFTLANLKTAVDAEKQYVAERAMLPKAAKTAPKTGTGGKQLTGRVID